jgi:hypothetical protein
VGRKVVLQGRLSYSLLGKSGCSVLRGYEEEARQRKIKEPVGQPHPTLYIKRK